MLARHDIAVIGSGFSGSLVAQALRRQGRSVLLLEQGRHPRFAIGESTTPLANLWLERFAFRHAIPGLASFSKWGTWQRDHPSIPCGLKRGFTFYQHETGRPFHDTARHGRQLLVAASPHDGIADTHWYRPALDQHLAREAEASGVCLREGIRLLSAEPAGTGMRLAFVDDGLERRVEAGLVIDATGPRGALFRLLGLAEEPIPGIAPNRAVFAHFEGVGRCADLPEFRDTGCPPYPPDDAAVHHVFPGGWIWVLRFNNGITSAGAALSPALAAAVHAEDGGPAWQRLLARLPSVQAQFRAARAVTPFVHQPVMPFLCRQGSGPGWVMLPSAQAFVDPMLSSGFPLTLLGMDRLVSGIHAHWGGPGLEGMCAEVARRSREDVLRVAALLEALYASFEDFPRFAALARVYFAIVSFAETSIRLGRDAASDPAFLLGDHPSVGPGLEALLREIRGADAATVQGRVEAFIRPIDVAGLLRRDRGNWHPVDAADLLDAADKLPATRAELLDLLRRCGFSPD